MNILRSAEHKEEWYLYLTPWSGEVTIEGPYTQERCDAIAQQYTGVYVSVEIRHHSEKPDGAVTRMPRWEQQG